MHSLIYQLDTDKIDGGNLVPLDSITPGDNAYIDYTDNTDDGKRKELISLLAESILPKGMFTVDGDGETLTYRGGFQEWERSYVKLIKDKASAINEGNVMDWIGPSYQLQRAISNPLSTDVLFITEASEYGGVAERSLELMHLIGGLTEGEKLYVGTIADYHF